MANWSTMIVEEVTTSWALLQIQGRSKPMRQVVRDLASEDIVTRYVAVQLLAESGDVSVLPALRRVEGDTRVIVTNAAVPLEVRTVQHAAEAAAQAIRKRAAHAR